MKQVQDARPSSWTSTATYALLTSLLFLPLALPGQATTSPEDSSRKLAEGHILPFKFTKVDLELLERVNQFDRYIEEQGWVYSDRETDEYLQKLGLSMVPEETPENVQWRFHVLRDIEANAFALPNGSIYVNSGLLSRMENEAQLAGVLAHEITHVVQRHSYLENRSARKKMVAVDIILAAASASYFARLSPVITTAMGNLLPMIVASTIFGYSRELEHDADVAAVETLVRRGYDLREFARGFELLRNGPEVDLSEEPVFWASHPKLDSRVKYVREIAARMQPNAAGLQVNEAAYRSTTANAIRHDAGLEMLFGRPRTAAAIAERLIAEEPKNAENYVLLGDAYRSLGARTPLPTSDELTDQAKEITRRRLHKMTEAEYDRWLLKEPRGAERSQENKDHAEEAFHKALNLDPQNATAHRGLGFLFERENASAEAIDQFQKYLELDPSAKDARQIRMHIERLKSSSEEHSPAQKSQVEGGAQVQ